MRLPALAETADFHRIDASLKLDSRQKSDLGQYLTPAPIGRFMASLFRQVSGEIRLLDPGAGVGSLSAAFVERCVHGEKQPRAIALTACEIDPRMTAYLEATLEAAEKHGRAAGFAIRRTIRREDFILTPPSAESFTHVIMNPPYLKINSASEHRMALRCAGIETSNLYSGFMYLAAQRLEPEGEMVAIVPRSFCNGPYFKDFRERFFAMMRLCHIHVFEKRDAAFKGDRVLQENVIVHAVKGDEPSTVRITTSRGGDFAFEAKTRECIGEDMTQREVDHAAVIKPGDPGGFVHIAANDIEQGIADCMAQFTTTLSDLGLEVSTGPVVDFRVREDLRAQPEKGTVPLLYPAHFRGGALAWPKKMKKPNAIAVTSESRKWLYANQGHYVVTKRFTAKEEKRRMVASVYASDLPGEWIGFENHLNVLHAGQAGFSASLAKGLGIYLNSSLVDRYFRQFSGHTQVNATDLRSLRYPDRATLERIGARVRSTQLTQPEIDTLIEQEELVGMAGENDPLKAQQKIEGAQAILKMLGMPRAQQNERSALTLLALLDLPPDGAWDQAGQPLRGITPIMDHCRDHYGIEYAPNTRETFRRQTMHQFVEAGIAHCNPDQPDRAVNSPHTCYQISNEAHDVIKQFGTEAWQTALVAYLERQPTLVAQWARNREMQRIPVQLPNGQEFTLTPGDHSELIQQIITQFAPRFAPGAELIYVGDTGDKVGYFQVQRLAELGVSIDPHGKMPDVVLHYGKRNWLLLVESVTSHGPFDAKRHHEMAGLFAEAKPGRVYVTAFPDRTIMKNHLEAIDWETEVWCADAPDHLIHFNGERFLGPHEGQGS